MDNTIYIKNEILNILLVQPYKVDSFSNLEEKEIKTLFFEYGINITEEMTKKIKAYNLTKETLPKTATLLKEELENIVKELNEEIESRKAKTKEIISQKCDELLEQNKNDEEIINMMVSLTHYGLVKIELRNYIQEYLKEKNKKEKYEPENNKEEQEKNQILEEIQKIEDYFFSTPSVLGENNSYIKNATELMSKDDINLLTNNGKEYDKETFANDLLGYIRESKRKDLSLEELKKIHERIKELKVMYELYKEIINEFNNLLKQHEKYAIFYEKYPLFDPTKILSKEEAQKVLNYIKKEVNNETISISNNEIVPIKGFILFAYDPKTEKTFILEDVDKNKPDSWKKDLSKMLYDLHVFGASEQLLTSHNSRLTTPVYDVDSKGNIDRTSRSLSSLWLTKPTLNSSVKYFERKIVLEKGSKKYQDMINLLKEYIKNVAEEPKFKLSVCYAIIYTNSKGNDITNEAKKRKNQATRMDNILDKENWDDEDLKVIREMIEKSLDAYDEIRKLTEGYNFDFIDQLRGGNIHVHR